MMRGRAHAARAHPKNLLGGNPAHVHPALPSSLPRYGGLASTIVEFKQADGRAGGGSLAQTSRPAPAMSLFAQRFEQRGFIVDKAPRRLVMK